MFRLIDSGGHPFVAAALRTHVPELEVCRLISPLDEMLITDELQLGWDQAATAYFDKGATAFKAYRALMRSYLSDAPLPLLDFGCGFGRLTRFLVASYDASLISVADVQEDALLFQRKTFGVQTLASGFEPGQLHSATVFKAVIANSFFTHLPIHRFGEWLSRLYGMIGNDGILMFSVHDESLIPIDSRDPSGFTFRTVSETDRLDSSEYGSAWVSEEFLRATISRTCPGSHLARWPRGLSDFQDLYVVSRRPLAPVSLDQGPFGFFSICRLEGRTLDLGGWASHRSPAHGVARVLIDLNGICVGSASAFFDRPDVVAHTGSEMHLRSGWWCRIFLDRTCSFATDILSIVAESGSGARTILYVGTIEAALRDACQTHLRSLGEDASIFSLLDPDTITT